MLSILDKRAITMNNGDGDEEKAGKLRMPGRKIRRTSSKMN